MYHEITRLYEDAKAGNVDSKEMLLNNLQPLIKSSIKKYYPNYREYEELVQEGNVVVLEAIDTYDPSKGTFFLGYVKTMLRYKYLNKYNERHHLSLNADTIDEEAELIDLLESREGDPAEILEHKESISMLNKALTKLTERQRTIVICYYVENMPIQEIANKLNISYRTVVNTKTAALKKMRNEIKI